MLTIEQLARLRSEMDEDERDVVLARHGISVEQWLEAQHFWLKNVTERGECQELAQRYCEAIESTRTPDVDGTAFLASLHGDATDPLPFADAPAAGAPAPVGSVVAGEAGDLVGGTVSVPALSAEELGTVLPFQTLPEPLARLGLEQVVSLTVDLQERPDQRMQILWRYGLEDEGQLADLLAVWNQRRKVGDTNKRWAAAELSYRMYCRRAARGR